MMPLLADRLLPLPVAPVQPVLPVAAMPFDAVLGAVSMPAPAAPQVQAPQPIAEAARPQAIASLPAPVRRIAAPVVQLPARPVSQSDAQPSTVEDAVAEVPVAGAVAAPVAVATVEPQRAATNAARFRPIALAAPPEPAPQTTVQRPVVPQPEARGLPDAGPQIAEDLAPASTPNEPIRPAPDRVEVSAPIALSERVERPQRAATPDRPAPAAPGANLPCGITPTSSKALPVAKPQWPERAMPTLDAAPARAESRVEAPALPVAATSIAEPLPVRAHPAKDAPRVREASRVEQVAVAPEQITLAPRELADVPLPVVVPDPVDLDQDTPSEVATAPVARDPSPAAPVADRSFVLPVPPEAIAVRAEPASQPEIEIEIDAEPMPAMVGVALAPPLAAVRQEIVPPPAPPLVHELTVKSVAPPVFVPDRESATTIEKPPVGFPAAIAAPLQPAAPPAPTHTVTAPVEARLDPVLDLSSEITWLDRLAREIADAAPRGAALAFRLHPERLGTLEIGLSQSDAGLSVQVNVRSEEARAIVAAAQPRMIEELRAQGLRVADTAVSNGGPHEREAQPQRAAIEHAATQDFEPATPTETSGDGRFA